MRKVYSILLLFLLTSFNDPVFAEGKKSALFIAPDQIASPGERIFLRVKLMAKSALLTKPISGERVEFIVEGRPIGVSLSGGDGVAVREFIPEREGNYRAKVRLTERSGYIADDTDIMVACWKKDRPIILVDLETLIDMDTEGKDPPDPAKGAAETLIRISKRYKIIIYAADHEEDLSKRKGWLRRHSFPEVPLLFWRRSDIGGELDSLISHGWMLKFGVGNRPRDIRAFVENNITPIIFLKDEDETIEDLPEVIKKVKGWDEVERIISDSSKGS